MWEQLRDPWTLGFGYAVPEFVDSEGLRYLRLYDVDERLTDDTLATSSATNQP